VQPQDALVIAFIGRFAPTKDVEHGPIFHEASDWLVVVGEKDVIPALEMGIRFMRIGERAVVWSHSKFAYGPRTRRNGEYELPPDANVRYEILVKSIVSDDEQSDPAFSLKLGLSRKQIGNDCYLNEWSNGHGRQRAKYLYERAARELEYLVQSSETSDVIRKQAMEVMLDCLNNVCAVHLRAKEYHQAKEAATKVLIHDPDNFKGLIRAAKAALLDPASSYDEVDAAIAAAEQNAPANDTDVPRLKADFKHRKHQYDQKSKAMFSNMAKTMQSNKKTDDEAKESAKKASEPKKDDAAEPMTEEGHILDWRSWPWKKTILPYVFQFVLPFIIVYVFTHFKKKETKRSMDDTSSSASAVDNEF